MSQAHTAMVAAIILNWENWPPTLRCLDALRESEFPQLAIIACDNASRDDSQRQIRAWADRNSAQKTGRDRWQLLTQPGRPTREFRLLCNPINGGFSFGNNAGIRAALETGADFVWLLNNDAVPKPDALSALAQAAANAPKAGIIGSVILNLERPEELLAWGGGKINRWLGTARDVRRETAPGRLDYITGASMLIRAQVFHDVGLLDEGFFLYWEDADFCVRARRAGWQFVVAPGAKILHEGSATVGRRGQERFYAASAVRMWRKHSRTPLVPILLGTTGRLAKRLLKGRWQAARVVLATSWSARSAPDSRIANGRH